MNDAKSICHRFRMVCLLIGLLGLFPFTAFGGSRPNIIVILVDDMGFSDIGCYGSEIQTPNIDTLASQGLRFKQFYNTVRCCPTRASLMTGLHPHQTGIGHMTEMPRGHSPLKDDPYQGYLNHHCVTIAQLLGQAGYHTFMTGKYDLSEEMPKRKADMKRTWESWARRTGVQFQTSFSFYGMFDDYQKSQKLPSTK